ncbi:hypothetical protein BGX26_005462, partial [Mortierella sp. AD094]
MVRFNQVLACITAPLLIAQTAYASFAICIGMSITDASHDSRFPSNGYGFYLWNEGGDNGAGRTIGYDSASLSGGGWTVTIDKNDLLYPRNVQVQNDNYSFSSKIHVPSLCQYSNPQRTRFVNFGCYDSGNNWCQQNQDGMKAQCNNHIELGINPDSAS